MAKRWRGARTRPAPQVHWERHGECSRCGDCCRHARDLDPAGWAHLERSTRAYLRAQGLDPNVPIDDTCANYDDATCTCKIHDRLEELGYRGCAAWPSHPQQLEKTPRCTYTFSEVRS